MSAYPSTPSFGQPFGYGPPGVPHPQAMQGYGNGMGAANGNMDPGHPHPASLPPAFPPNHTYSYPAGQPMQPPHGFAPHFPNQPPYPQPVNAPFPPPPYPPVVMPHQAHQPHMSAPPPFQSYPASWQVPTSSAKAKASKAPTTSHRQPRGAAGRARGPTSDPAPAPTAAAAAPIKASMPTSKGTPTATLPGRSSAAVRSREEGELTDEDMIDAPPPANTRHRPRPELPSKAAAEKASSAERLKSRAKALGTDEPPKSLPRKPTSTGDEVTSATSHSQAEQASDTSMPATTAPEPAAKSAGELRKLAKNAILNLLPFHISFSQLLAEGIQEDVVRDLFDELRLNYPSRQASQPTPAAASEQTEQPRAPASIPSSRKPENQKAPAPPSAAAAAAAAASATAPIAAPSAKATKAPEPVSSQSSVAKPSAAQRRPSQEKKFPLKATPLTNLANGRSAVEKAEAGKKLERKDLIALKLAARQVKANSVLPEPASAKAPSSKAAGGLAIAPPSAGSMKTDPAKKDAPVQAKVAKASADPAAAAKAGISKPASQVLAQPRPTLPAKPTSSSATLEPGAAESAPRKSSDTTELIRQRLASMQQAAREKEALAKASSKPSPASEEESKPKAQMPLRPLAPAETPAASATPTRPSVSPASQTIPGLFMAGGPNLGLPEKPPASAATPTADELLKVPGSGRRKRPVAADFDAPADGASGSIKRPFGHSRLDRPLVIDVSDDETAQSRADSDVDMDDDDETFAPSPRPVPPARTMSAHSSMRDMPPLPDFPNKRRPLPKANGRQTPTTGPHTSSNTPTPHVNGGGKAVAHETLKEIKQKEEQISSMLRKIAELEQQRKTKQSDSRAATPPKATAAAAAAAPAPATSSKTSVTAAAKVVHTTDEIDRLISDTHRQVERDQRELAQAKAEQDMVRQVEEPSSVESSAATTPASASEGQAAAVAGPETEGSGRSSVSRETVEQQAVEPKPHRAETAAALEQRGGDEGRAQGSAHERQVRQSLEKKLQLVAELEAIGVEVPRGLLEVVEAQRRELGLMESDTLEVTPKESDPSPTAGSASMSRDEAGQAEQVAGAATATAAQSIATAADRSPVPDVGLVEEPMTSASVEVATVDAKQVEASVTPPSPPMDVDEVMGGMPEAEARPQSPEPAATAVTEGKGQADEPGPEYGEQVESDSDEYEPPDTTPPAASPSPLSSSSSEADDGPSELISGFSMPSVVADVPPPVPVRQDEPALVGVDAASNLVNLARPASRRWVDVTQDGGHDYFRPYVSPLRQFPSFRYHGDYLETVPDGYRSLTYSHHIDAERPLCKYEAGGGVCNDSACDGQHFRDMVLSDDMILMQMGSSNEGRTAEEREKYTDGLRQVLQELRSQKVKDFSTVASQIARYRASFLQDRSRVLSLDAPAQ